jgi:hypothetical protein
MRVLILHQNRYYKVRYDEAIDHAQVDVCYAATQEYLDQIPAGLRHTRFVLDSVDAAAEQLEPWMRTQPAFDRILTRQENWLMLAATLRERFGISGMKPQQVILFRDKVLMKNAVASAGLRVPRHRRIDAALDGLPWRGKTVLKPVDGAGSRGIRLFDTAQQAADHVREAIANGDAGGYARHFELEEFVDGPIWHVDGYLHQGRPVAIQTSKYVGTCLDYEFGQPVGSVQYRNPELERWALRCLAALGAQDLTFHLEAIASADGPVFLEVAARAGGGDIVETFERASGVPLHALDMASDVDGRLAQRFAVVKSRGKTYGFFLVPGHKLHGAPCRVCGADVLLQSPLVEDHHRLGPQDPTPKKATYQAMDVPLAGIVAGNSGEELEQWMRALFQSVRVEPA